MFPKFQNCNQLMLRSDKRNNCSEVCYLDTLNRCIQTLPQPSMYPCTWLTTHQLFTVRFSFN